MWVNTLLVSNSEETHDHLLRPNREPMITDSEFKTKSSTSMFAHDMNKYEWESLIGD